MTSSWTEESVLALIRECFAEYVGNGAHAFLDDGAVLSAVPAKSARVISCDAFQEEHDFLVGIAPVETAGFRAIVQNVSDIAAMGAKPRGFVWALEIPEAWLLQNANLLRRFCNGAVEACRKYKLPLLGGDLSFSNKFSCTVTILGDVKEAPLSRRGAKPGDQIYVSRKLGLSSYGLQILLRSKKTTSTAILCREFDRFVSRLKKEEKVAVVAHLNPSAEVLLARKLVQKASACMDISDGLARDLHRLCAASKVGALIDNLDAAIHEALPSQLARDFAWHGGEDFALLFTVSKRKSPPKGSIRIGEITNETGTIREVHDNRSRIVKPEGYDHFASRDCGQAFL